MSTTNSIGAPSAPPLMRTAFRPPSFSSLDANSDKSLTLDELELNAPKGASAAEAKSRAQALFSAMDGDGDGSVTSSEKETFDTQMASRRQTMAFMTQQLAGPSNAEIFKQTDTSGDGAVTIDELAADEGADSISSENLQQLFDLIDADGDGSITETESSDFLDSVKTALQETAGHSGRPPAGGPPPGGPPPAGGPPPGPPPSDDSEDDETVSATTSLFTAAQAAYQTSQQQTLLEQLASIFDNAA